MAIFYVGPRPVLKGRNANDDINPYNGRSSNYSNYSIFNTSHVLDGAPNNNHTIGTGTYPHGLKMSRLFKGLENAEQPLDGPGLGARQTYDGRFGPLLYKGLSNNTALKGTYGHSYGSAIYGTQRYHYSNFVYDGIGTTVSQPLKVYGHGARYIGAAGTANTFGRFAAVNDPGSMNIGVDPLEDSGHALSTTNDYDDIGFARINVWQGVPSAQALGSKVNG